MKKLWNKIKSLGKSLKEIKDQSLALTWSLFVLVSMSAAIYEGWKGENINSLHFVVLATFGLINNRYYQNKVDKN